MSALDRLKELDKQRDKLVRAAKAEALKKAEEALTELSALGFNYKLIEAGAKTSGTRRKGIRNEILTVIQKHPNGIARADIIAALSAKGDAAAEQSVSNALSALKKQGKVSSADGKYRAL